MQDNPSRITRARSFGDLSIGSTHIQSQISPLPSPPLSHAFDTKILSDFSDHRDWNGSFVSGDGKSVDLPMQRSLGMSPPLISRSQSFSGGSGNGGAADGFSPSSSLGCLSPSSQPPKKLSLYKTELCRSFEETGYCRYGSKCQFAHSLNELRNVNRHPKYKTEICKTFWNQGTCPYGKRCCFIHMERLLDELPMENSSEDHPVQSEPPSDSFAKVLFTGIPQNPITKGGQAVDKWSDVLARGMESPESDKLSLKSLENSLITPCSSPKRRLPVFRSIS